MDLMVTGGSGFLGSHVIPRLVAQGHKVAALSRSTDSARKVEKMGAKAVVGDLDDPASLDAAFTTCRGGALVNLAPLELDHAPALVAAAEGAALRRAIFVSTTAIFTSLDVPSKAWRIGAEEVIKASALDWTIIRPTMIYGTAQDRNMVRLLGLLRHAPVVPLPGGGHRLQQPVHVDDLAAAIVAALASAATVGRAYDVAGDVALSLRQIVEQAADAVGRCPRLFTIPLGPTLAMARAYERVATKPRLKAEQIERLAEDKVFDIDAARRDLGFAPRPFAQGIRQEAEALA
jgi:nucleoside-diphosphate-sugar epimerase